MSWLASNWDAIVGIAGGAFGFWQRAKAAKAKKEADRLAKELDAIRVEAGTKRPP